jgi:hypothetical protein
MESQSGIHSDESEAGEVLDLDDVEGECHGSTETPLDTLQHHHQNTP